MRQPKSTLDTENSGQVSSDRTPLSDPRAKSFGIIHDATLDRRARVRVALSIFLPLAGTLYALLASVGPTGTTIMVGVPLFIATGLGINLSLHRYFSHASFKTGRFMRAVLAICAGLAMQGPISVWVADHRRHHRFPDRPGDPHSPYWYEERRFTSRLAGFWHAHFLWMFRQGITDVKRYAPDILADSMTAWHSRHYWAMCILSLGMPMAVGYEIGGSQEALRCFLWAGCVRVTVLHEVTRAVNSYCHMFGWRAPGARDESRDNWWAFWLWWGEGLHGYHHRHPSSAVNEPAHWDPIGQVILLAQRAGLVWDVRRGKSGHISEESLLSE